MLGLFHEAQKWSLRVICGVKNEQGKEYEMENQGTLDNGGKYTSDPFLQLCRDEGIEIHFTVRETPQQNEGGRKDE